MLKSIHDAFLLAGGQMKIKSLWSMPEGHGYGFVEKALNELRRRIMPGVVKRIKHLPIASKEITGVIFCQPPACPAQNLVGRRSVTVTRHSSCLMRCFLVGLRIGWRPLLHRATAFQPLGPPAREGSFRAEFT
jgi:hypothetical protein